MSQGHPVGIDFGNLCQCSEDEMGGITPTLPQTERGRWEPVTHVTQPSSTRQESGTHRRLQYTVLNLCSSALFLNASLLIVCSPES